MSGDLLAHVRYPEDLFKVQREILGKYHVTNAGTFYSREDEWATPADPTDESDSPGAQPPYYLTMGVNGEDPAFTLYSTYIPKSGRDVLYGYLSVNADAGSTAGEVSDSYGQLTLQSLPKDQSIPGPGQVQNTFDTDNDVSGELNLLRQGSTTVINGNLLTLPAGGGLLYVQPVYLRSTGDTSFPVLRKVLVAFGDQIAFEDTLDQALDSLFGGDSGAAAGDEDTEVDPDGDASDEATPSDDTSTATPERAELLTQASELLQQRQDAYADGDLVAAAEADEKLTGVLEQLFALEGEATATATPTPTDGE